MYLLLRIVSILSEKMKNFGPLNTCKNPGVKLPQPYLGFKFSSFFIMAK